MKTKITILIAGVAVGLTLGAAVAGAAAIKRPMPDPQTLEEKTAIIYARIKVMRYSDGAWRPEIVPAELAKLLAEMAGSQQIRK